MRPKKRWTRKSREAPQEAAPATRVLRKGRYTNAPPETVGDPTRVEVQVDDVTLVVEPEPATEPVDKYAARATVGYGNPVGTVEPAPAAPAPAAPAPAAPAPPPLPEEETPPEWGPWVTVASRDGMRYQRHDSRLETREG